MKKTFEYLEAFLLILTCSSVYYVAEYKNYHLVEILIVVSFINLIISFFSGNIEKKKLNKAIIFCIFYYLLMIIFILINSTNIYNFIALFMILFPIFYLQYKISEDNNNINNILYKIPKIMTVIALISIFFYFFGSLTNIISSNGYMTVEWEKIRTFPSYFGLHFNTQKITLFGTDIIRNTGIYPEAPMFSLNLTIALAIELFILDKKSKYRVIILALTVLTTLSTTGIILVSFMIITKYLLTNKKSKIYTVIKIYMFPLVAICLIGVSLYFWNDKMQTSSYESRTDDYRASYLAWKDHPIFGNGYNDTTAIVNYMTNYRGVSNSFMVVLAEGGIYLFMLYLIPAIRIITYGIKYKNKNILIFTSIIIFLYITTTFQYRPILLNLLAAGFAFEHKKINQNIKIQNNI